MYFGGTHMKIENLNQLPLNKSGKINKIECGEGIKRRLLDMGLVKGTEITPILIVHLEIQEHFLLEVLLLL